MSFSVRLAASPLRDSNNSENLFLIQVPQKQTSLRVAWIWYHLVPSQWDHEYSIIGEGQTMLMHHI